MPEPGILRLDDRAFVAVVRYGEIVVGHYAFAVDLFLDVLVRSDG